MPRSQLPYSKLINFIKISFATIWLILFIICILVSHNILNIKAYQIIAWPLTSLVHAITIFFIFKIVNNFNKEDRKALLWFLAISIWLFFTDLFFYFATQINRNYIFEFSLIQFLFYYAPCIIFCVMMLIFLSKILLREVLQKLKLIRILGGLLTFNIVTLGLFLLSIHYSFNVISWQIASQVALLIAETILFDFAVLGLMYANNISIIMMLAGPIFLITGDFSITYSYMSQTIHLLLYGQLLWLLGLLLILYSVINIWQNKLYKIAHWFGKSNAIKSQLAFWVFSTSIIGFLVFFIIASLLSIVNKSIFVGLPLFVMMYSVIAISLSLFMGKRFEAPFKKITNNIGILMHENDKNKIDDNFTTEEFIFLQKFIINSFTHKEEKDFVKKELGEITAQVAHDIRSPLAALDTIVVNIGNKVSEQERIMMRTAFRRINNIANDLVAKYKGQDHNPNTLVFIYVVLKNIISEKDLEYGNKNIHFELTIDQPQSAFLLTKGNYKEISRMFSNLINNAINAMPSGGRIQISCIKTDQEAFIKIIDQGVGMSKSRVEQLLSADQAKNTHIGLGLKHAKDYVKRHGGCFDIKSTEGKGTEICISFPILSRPKWLAEKVICANQKPVMVIDDDASIHDIWIKKFEGIKVIRKDFYNIEDAYEIISTRALNPGLILCDYEFMNQGQSGLDFFERIKHIKAMKYLVTSHIDNEAILNQCEALNLQLIPKHLLPYVFIEIKQNVDTATFTSIDRIDAVFIDDTPYNHEFWQYAAQRKNKKLKCYLSFEAFEQAKAEIPKNTPIYIDLNLGATNGLEAAKKLHAEGFKKLYITTGYADFDIDDHPYLSGVISKNPPF